MTRKEYIKKIENVEIKEDVEKELEKTYGGNIPDEVLKILSASRSPELFDENESRTLSLREVINAEEDNGISFARANIIPIADFGDNNFVVYLGDSKKWAMYNILDEIAYNENDTFEKVFLA